MSTHTAVKARNPSLSDNPPVQWRTATLEVIDSIAASNAGATQAHGKDCISITRTDWAKLMDLRGTDEEVLARVYVREERAMLAQRQQRNRR